MKYANIIFDRNGRLTIGDDIQLIAIENLYKEMGINISDIVRIPFHELSVYDGEYVILPVSFPFYGYHTDLKITQFSPKIIPVFLAVSMLTDYFSEEELNYLKRFEPIGCRDAYTMTNLRKHHVMAYLNGCMTATLPQRSKNITGDKIYCIDIQEELKEYIPSEIKNQAVFTSHTFYPEELTGSPQEKALELLEEYKNHAKLVITSRLHGALPCIAMGIPVIFAKDKLSFRFLGVNQLTHIYTKAEFSKIEWNPAPVEYESMKKMMLKTAMQRIRETERKYKDIFALSSFFEKQQPDDFHIEFFTNTVEFIEETFHKDQPFSYILWGVTQTASLVYKYISDHYRFAELIGVIDQKKEIMFEGNMTTKKHILSKNKDAWCFVCTGAAIKESYEYFQESGHRRFYQCCEDGTKHAAEKGYKNTYQNVSL